MQPVASLCVRTGAKRCFAPCKHRALPQHLVGVYDNSAEIFAQRTGMLKLSATRGPVRSRTGNPVGEVMARIVSGAYPLGEHKMLCAD
jgi:hypothetical protein